MTKPIGVLGGTFDPVHHGHLRLAIECCERLALAGVRLVPLRVPPHRKPPHAAPEHRLAMLKLATQTTAVLQVDESELHRQNVSYTIDTVTALRRACGHTPLCLLLGTDAFNLLHTWYRWQALLDYVHIVIAERPGATSMPENTELRGVLDRHAVVDASVLHTSESGAIFRVEIPWLDISATRIRDMLRRGHNPSYLLPDTVIDYIHTHRLYADT